MTNLDNVLKRRDVTLPTKVRPVKATVFPVVNMDVWVGPWEMVKDREAWRAAVHGIAKSWTQLSDWTTTRFNFIMVRENNWNNFHLCSYICYGYFTAQNMVYLGKCFLCTWKEYVSYFWSVWKILISSNCLVLFLRSSILADFWFVSSISYQERCLQVSA